MSVPRGESVIIAIGLGFSFDAKLRHESLRSKILREFNLTAVCCLGLKGAVARAGYDM